MENGAVYSPTTEAAPGPGRGARSGLAAYFFLGRLPLYRRILKGLQLVSQRRRRTRGRRGRGRGRDRDRDRNRDLWAGVDASRLPLGLLVREAAVSTSQFLPFLPGKEALPSASYPWPGLSHLNLLLSAKILSIIALSACVSDNEVLSDYLLWLLRFSGCWSIRAA